MREEPIEEPKDAAAEPFEEPVWEEPMAEAEPKDAAAVADAADEACSVSTMEYQGATLWNGAYAASAVCRAWKIGLSDTPGRRYSLPMETVKVLRAEQEISEHHKVPWKERGPLALGDDEPHAQTVWRGQKLRNGKQGGKVRFANSGGTHREYYAMLARTGRIQAHKGGAKVLQHVRGWQQGDPHRERYRSAASSSGAGSSGGGGGTGARRGYGADGDSSCASSRGCDGAPWRR